MKAHPARDQAGRARQRGFALLAVLWLVVLLAIVAASFGTVARTEVHLGRNAVEKAKAEALADAGVHRAILALLEPEPAVRWRTDGAVYRLALAGGEVRVAIQDETGKIDLNMASDELLRGLFMAVGLGQDEAAAMADAVADFRDPDDLRRLHGAETADYLAAGLPYGSKDAPFQAIEELQQVLGMTAALYRRVAPLVTVYSWEDGIDPMVASREVLLAVPGITTADVEAILTARAELQRYEAAIAAEDVTEADLALDPYAAVASVLMGLEEFTSAAGGWVYTVRSEAETSAGGGFVREAVVALDFAERPYSIYSWKRGERQAPPG